MSADLPAFRAEGKRESQRLGDRCAMSQKLLFICSPSFSVIFGARSEMSSTDLSSAETHKRELSRSLVNSDQIRHSESLKNFQLRTSATFACHQKSGGGARRWNSGFLEFNSSVMLDTATLSSAFGGSTTEAWVYAERLPKTQKICYKFLFATFRRPKNPPGNVTSCK